MSEIVIEKLTPVQLSDLNIPESAEETQGWSVWECDPSTFDWHYDRTEVAYLYAGRVRVRSAQQELEVRKGDYVTFPAGLSCTWEVLEKIEKVYKFI